MFKKDIPRIDNLIFFFFFFFCRNSCQNGAEIQLKTKNVGDVVFRIQNLQGFCLLLNIGLNEQLTICLLTNFTDIC